MPRFQVRRATVEDVPQLRSLWEMGDLQVEELEKRFTEFQVAHNEQGEIVATLGLQMTEDQGRLYGEVIAWFDFAEELRTQLWTRLEVVARNQGLSRLWTDLEDPFWKGVGFKKASTEMLGLRPSAFGEGQGESLYFPLRAAGGAGEEVEKQLAVLKAISHAETQRLMDRARVMKWVAMGLITAVFAAFAVWVVYYALLRKRVQRKRSRDW